jgi:MazG family protein
MTADLPDRRATAIHRLLELMARLRDPADGCPWDREQTFRTIAPYTIEEAYEVADAIERDDRGDLREELGDLLFQVVFHARMAEEEGAFDFVDVADGLTDKMIRRHPHVFRRDEVGGEVRWEETKEAERARKARPDASILDGVAAGLPALMRAEKLQKRAARVGFDWPEARQVLAKIREEIDEVDAEIAAGDAAKLEGEIGDLLFAVVNLARHVGVDSEAALRGCNAKFERRFTHIERALRTQGRGPKEATLDEMEALWAEAKGAERSR